MLPVVNILMMAAYSIIHKSDLDREAKHIV